MDFQSLGSRWIWNGNGADAINQYVCFRKEFNLNRKERYLLHICADTDFAVWINGRSVGFGGYSAYPKDKYYDTLDVSDYLKPGVNVLCVLAYYQGINTFCYAKGTPCLIFALVSKEDIIPNEGTLVCEGSGFISGDMPRISPQLGPSFSYDANLETDWKALNYHNVNFNPAVELPFSLHLPRVLKKRPVRRLDVSGFQAGTLLTQGHFMYRNETGYPAPDMQNAFMSFKEHDEIIQDGKAIAADGIYLIYDLECEIAGYITFDLHAAAGTQIDIAWGEHLDDLRIRAFVGNRNFAFRYIAKEGENHFTGYFRRIAGRYIQINISKMSAPCKLERIGLKPSVYPNLIAKPPNTIDPLCAEIDKTCIQTLILCMNEHFEDSPWREQALYAMDARIQALCGYYVFGSPEYYRFVKASLDLLAASLRDDGFLDICAPSDAEITIPSFSFMWITWACEYVFHSGDLKSGERYLTQICQMLSKYFAMFENGLLKNSADTRYWHFYDWQPFLDGNKKHFRDFDVLANLFLYLALLNAIKLSGVLNRPEKNDWTRFLREFKRNINRRFYDVSLKLYNLYPETQDKRFESELAQSLALICGICPNSQALRKRISARNGMIPVTLSSSIFKYDALLQDKAYLESVIQEITRIWGDMLKRGATTFFETQDGANAFDRAGSLCHGWSAAPAYVFRRYCGRS